MAMIVPYRSTGARTAMIERAMSTVGTRAHGRQMFVAPPHRTFQPVPAAPQSLAGLGCCGPVGYEAAKRQTLGTLGLSLTTGPVRQVYGGVTTGVAAAGIATSVATSVAGAIGAGAAAGSVVPIIGTAIGAIVGLLASGILNHRTDPEVANFNQAIALYKQNPTSVVNIADKYLVLAGLFDLQTAQIKGNIPIVKKYGRMGEQRFTTDMVTQIYNAAQSGRITASDTPLTVMSKVVQPWIDSFGFGPMTDSNGPMITYILIGMIADYVTGNQKVWSAVGGDFPFANLPPFSLPQTAAPPAALPAQPQSTCAPPYVWNGTQCVLPNAPALSTPGAATQVAQDQALAAQGWTRAGTNGNGYPLYTKPGMTVVYALVNGALVPTTMSTATAPTVSNCAAPYVWNGTQCVLPNNALPPPQPLPASILPPPSYSQVGTDASGNTIYANPQGVLYSWVGTGMQIFSGQLASGNSSAAQMQAALQNALAQGQSSQQAAAAAIQQAQSAGVAVTPQLQQQVAAQVDATQAAPLQPVAAAGIGGGLGTVASVVSIAAAVLGLMFATARHQTPPKAPRVRKSPRRG